MLRIIFMGTPDFAISALDTIYDDGHELLGVVTQPDRPKGRGKKLAPPPVKEWAIAKGIPVYQPSKVNSPEFIDDIKALKPDIIVTAAYGRILSKDILDIPRLGCINVHASLLPKYRGASPIQQAILNGDMESGITIMYMDEEMDTGDIILQERIDIGKDERVDSLHDRLAKLGGKAISKALTLLEEGKAEATSQDHSQATYCSKIDKSQGEIDWANRSIDIKNLVRALTPYPGSYTFIDKKRLKIWKVDIVHLEDVKKNNTIPGEVKVADVKDGLIVACGDGYLRLFEVQGSGGRPMADTDYLKGHDIKVGTIFGRQKEIFG